MVSKGETRADIERGEERGTGIRERETQKS